MKICTKCGTAKPLSAFGRNSQSKSGIRPDCKVCVNAERALWRELNKDKWDAQVRAYREANRKKLAARQAEYRLANPEKIAEQMAAWLEKNRDAFNARRRADRLANPEFYKQADANRYANNPISFRIRNQTRRARKKAGGGEISAGLPEKLYRLQRGMCACGCKQPLGDDFHLDHIMPLALGGSNTDDNIQLLRALCNRQKSAKHPVDFMQSRGYLL